MRRFAFALVLPLALAACAGGDNVYASMKDVREFSWTEPGPTKLTLLTVVNNRGDEGAHSALMVTGSQRVLFDPAGSWSNPAAPERGDVKYGITPPMLANYIDYHARPEFRVIVHEMDVTPEMAEMAIRTVEAHGPSNKATCGRTISGVLRDMGFTEIGRSWFPKRIMSDFARLPGVTETVLRDDTDDDYWGVPDAVVDVDVYDASV
ncbi:MAG: hypothetical protein AAF390_00290 [Pseudomonadota bacterium]